MSDQGKRRKSSTEPRAKKYGAIHGNSLILGPTITFEFKNITGIRKRNKTVVGHESVNEWDEANGGPLANFSTRQWRSINHLKL